MYNIYLRGNLIDVYLKKDEWKAKNRVCELLTIYTKEDIKVSYVETK